MSVQVTVQTISDDEPSDDDEDMHLLEETVSKKLLSKPESAKKCNYAELERKLFAWFIRLEQSQALRRGEVLKCDTLFDLRPRIRLGPV